MVLVKADLTLADNIVVIPVSEAAALGWVNIMHVLVQGNTDIDVADQRVIFVSETA